MMKKLTIILLVLVCLLAVVATTALAGGYPGTVLWKQECPPWATVRVVDQPDGGAVVFCMTYDREETP